jgi:hypothetical protein
MKHIPISTTEANNHRADNGDSRNLNAIDRNGLTPVADRDRSKPAQLTLPKTPPVSIWVGLGMGIIVAGIVVGRYVPATSTDLDTANARIIASKQGDVCTAPSPIQSPETIQAAQVAFSLSQTHLAQTGTNLQKFQADYSRYKSLASQGKATGNQLQAAKVAYDLAQLQKSSALEGLQHAQAQLAAVRVENC